MSSSGGSSASRAAAAVLMSGPACRPRRRNSRPALAFSCWYDQESTARTLAAAWPASSASSRPPAPRSSADSAARDSAGWLALRAAAMLSASGSPAHNRISSSAAGRSPATRSAPRRRASSSCASASASTSRVSGEAPSAATSGVSWLRLVTMTRQPGLAGSSGRTCSTSRALSRRTRIRLSASTLRYRPDCASSPEGIRADGTDSASSSSRIASAGGIGGPAGSKPRRLTYSCPSGNRSATWCAKCRASVVLPIPAVPSMTAITVAVLPPVASPARPASVLRASARPAKCRVAAGSCRGATWSCAAAEFRRPAAAVGVLSVLAGPGGSASSGRSSSLSAARMRWCSTVSSGPGSMPSSSASTRRTSWNAASASACRPLRYRLSMSCAWNCSCSGCAATSWRSSATTSPCRPSCRSASMRVASACSRWSTIGGTSRSRSSSDGTSASGSPRHSPSAWRSWSAASVHRPASAAAWPREASMPNARTSSCPSSSVIR